MKKLQAPVDEGWSIHVYDRKRRLLCTLEPSHGWAFGLGCIFGLLIAMAWGNLVHHSRSATPANSPEAPQTQVD
ncbi:MAG: hypothetical protein ACFB4J_17220 [Elainellaceae cyanobacterium]